MGADQASVVKAAEIAKCDLLTGMVGEFADLQGIMGYYYASHDGETEEVAMAMNEQYMPRFAGDDLPVSKTGMILALAERLDTIVGLFGIGQPPTGSKDPYALRRAALGILRIIVEKKLDLDLSLCITKAIDQYSVLTVTEGLHDSVQDFIFERFRAWYSDEGVPANIFQSVYAVRPTAPLDFDLRIKAVKQFSMLEESAALSMANKRVSNILSKLALQPSLELDNKLLTEPAEQRLAAKLSELLVEVEPLLASQNYTNALSSMANLQKEVDDFFDQVMVNTDDEQVRNNRQSLLQQLRHLFLQIADISFLQNT
jgi:glycyl-tRNA synthetase beta chain